MQTSTEQELKALLFIATVTMAPILPQSSTGHCVHVFKGMTWLPVSAFLPVIADRHFLQTEARGEEMKEMQEILGP